MWGWIGIAVLSVVVVPLIMPESPHPSTQGLSAIFLVVPVWLVLLPAALHQVMKMRVTILRQDDA